MNLHTYTKTGLRPVGARRARVFDVGESRDAVLSAEAGDELSDDLVSNLSDEGLDRFSRALARRGLEFGEISGGGPPSHDPITWLLYPCGKSSEAWAAIVAECEITS